MAKSSYGAILRLGVPPAALTAVANLTSITPPNMTRAALDSTTHGGDTDAMEFIADGVYDPGEITVAGDLILGSGADDIFVSAIKSGDLHSFELEGKSASGREEMSGSCIVTAYTPGALEVTGKQTFTATLKVSGEVTQGPAS